MNPPDAPPRKKTVWPVTLAFERPETASAGAVGADVSTLTVALVPACVPSLPTRSEIRSR